MQDEKDIPQTDAAPAPEAEAPAPEPEAPAPEAEAAAPDAAAAEVAAPADVAAPEAAAEVPAQPEPPARDARDLREPRSCRRRHQVGRDIQPLQHDPCDVRGAQGTDQPTLGRSAARQEGLRPARPWRRHRCRSRGPSRSGGGVSVMAKIKI